jgi:hypothetical protein
MYQDIITVQYQTLSIADHQMWVGIMRFINVPDPQKITEAYNELFPEMAQHFLASPQAETQKTVALITDSGVIMEKLSFEQIEYIVKNMSDEAYATQRYLYELFKRPVLQISIVPPNANLEALRKLLIELNPEGNTLNFVASESEALELAAQLLKLAHRL